MTKKGEHGFSIKLSTHPFSRPTIIQCHTSIPILPHRDLHVHALVFFPLDSVVFGARRAGKRNAGLGRAQWLRVEGREFGLYE